MICIQPATTIDRAGPKRNIGSEGRPGAWEIGIRNPEIDLEDV